MKIPAAAQLVTEDDYATWAHTTREWIERQISTPEASAALAAAEERDGLTISEHPFDRFVALNLLVRRGCAPEVSPEWIPDFPKPPAWATESAYDIAAGCGAAEITFYGRNHGEEVTVTVEEYHEIVLWPDLYDNGSEVGSHYTDGPSLTWDPAAAERLATKSASAAMRFAAALAAAAEELADINARDLTRFDQAGDAR
ncbi:hypothetical protein [Microbacterium saperdae]|uniref:Uncharacterized protein n=1 Tax=Microbacterium saperdae TaxID=69368 RepID=A0A543BJA2_9MICO|nr:hypothetical protein [Microbacterium saperdae]TQL84888.1 hypothetical protein FB560_0481 [Microbacterium saperdae]GGM58605.1 hypothetical protein GCM10010489_32850 [Microbacterium saperdae]